MVKNIGLVIFRDIFGNLVIFGIYGVVASKFYHTSGFFIFYVALVT